MTQRSQQNVPAPAASTLDSTAPAPRRRWGPARSIAAAAWSAPAVLGASPIPVRWLRPVRHRLAAGGVIALAIAVGCVIELGSAAGLEPFSRWMLTAMLSLPAVVTLVAPLLTWRIMTLALFASALLLPAASNDWPWPLTAFSAYLVVTLLVAVTIARGALFGVALLACVLTVLPAGPQDRMPDGVVFLLIALVILVVSLGGVFRGAMATRRALAVEIERSEAELVRAAALAERAKLARELHDVVAHHMSLIAIQADVTPHAVPDLPPAAREAFGSIRTESTTALAEMRRLVDSLRDEDGGADRTPQPTLADLERLVESVRATGTAIDAELEPVGRDAPAPVAISIYRIAQEALANAVQHAPGASIEVTLRVSGDDLVLTVTNGAPARVPVGPPESRTRRGQGLIGMRERASALGGDLSTTSTPDGGFTVRARLPLAEPGPRTEG